MMAQRGRGEGMLNGENSRAFHVMHQPEPSMVSHSTSQLSDEPLEDEFLADLANDIESEEDAESLGRALGFKQAEINRFMATNRLSGSLTSKGTREMLLAWRQRVSPLSDRPPVILRDALLRAGLGKLAEQYCGQRLHHHQEVAASGQLPCCFQKHLKTIQSHYKKVVCQIHRRPWDPDDYTDLKHLFTDITLFKYDRSTGEVQKIALDGSVNSIFSTMVSGELPTRMLLTAPGGHGKTCAVAKLAYDWVHRVDGSPMRDIQALFVLKLREVGESMGLGEAIMSQLVGVDYEVTPEEIEHFLENHQESCALICDGYDEYKGSIKTSSESNSLVLVLRNKKLKNLRVMVTTRPYLEGDFLQGELAKTYSKMVIEGFTSEYAAQYIKRYFCAKSKPNEGNALVGKVERNAFLRNLTQVPLFCTMICHLCEVGALLSDVQSMTSLFDHINHFLLEHALAKEVPLLGANGDERLEDVLSNLGRFAFDGLRSDSRQLVFQKEHFQHHEEAYRTGVKLGILSATHIPVKHATRNQRTANTTVEFFHKLEQEYCASVFLRNIDKKNVGSGSLSVLRTLTRPSSLEAVLKRDVGTVARTLEFEDVLCFVAGASPTACLSVFRHIAHQVRDFVLYYKCRLVLHCLVEADPSFVDKKVARALERCFWDGKLDLHPLTERILIGLEKLPQDARDKISFVSLFSTHLSPEMTVRLWSCMATFHNLRYLYLNNASVSMDNNDSLLAPLPSVRKFEAWNLGEDTFRRLITQSLPDVEELVVWIGNGFNIDRVVTDIAGGVESVGATLKWMVINGLLNGTPVSVETCMSLGGSIRHSAIRLESICLEELRVNNEEGLIAVTEECRSVETLKEIRFKFCGIQLDGALHAFLKAIGTPGVPSARRSQSYKGGLVVTVIDVDFSALCWQVSR